LRVIILLRLALVVQAEAAIQLVRQVRHLTLMPQLSQTAAVVAHQVVHLPARVFQEVQAQAAQEAQRWVLLLKGTQVVQQVTEMLAAQDHLVVD
jgi:hypothetical protein